MSDRHKDRQRRLRKAFEKGAAARAAGVSLSANPYVISAWNIGQEWARGWNYQEHPAEWPPLSKEAA